MFGLFSLQRDNVKRHSKLNKIYFLPISRVIIVYRGKMIRYNDCICASLVLSAVNFWPNFRRSFPSVLTEPLSLRSAVKLKVTAVKIRGLHGQQKVAVGLSVHKNIYWSNKTRPHCQCLRARVNINKEVTIHWSFVSKSNIQMN